MDVLSEVLKAARLTGALYFDVRPRAPWVAETPPLAQICAKVMPEFDYIIGFHIMLEGWCYAWRTDGAEPAVRMEQGDIILFPHGDGHVLGTEPGSRAEPDFDIYYRPDDHCLPFVLDELGGDGEPARFVCGYIGCDAQPFNPILNALPRMLLVQTSKGARNPAVELIQLALAESTSLREGGETILAKLSELMFVEALRQYIDELPAGSGGWLLGLRDPYIAAALNLIHGRSAEDWTLERLSKEVHLSRSAFVERFSHYVQEPPMRYLARWRMQLALRLLESRGISIAQVGDRVGYRSEAAFNRVFKKHVGVPPGQWRRAHLRGDSV